MPMNTEKQVLRSAEKEFNLALTVFTVVKHAAKSGRKKQVDITISKNQALQILYLVFIV